MCMVIIRARLCGMLETEAAAPPSDKKTICHTETWFVPTTLTLLPENNLV